MSRSKREIECLLRLQETTSQLEEILLFLKNEDLISDNEVRTVRQSSDHPKDVQSLLKRLKTDGKFQLLEYQWEILPVERIKILIITDRTQKEFCYNV